LHLLRWHPGYNLRLSAKLPPNPTWKKMNSLMLTDVKLAKNLLTDLLMVRQIDAMMQKFRLIADWMAAWRPMYHPMAGLRAVE
jgi:hypothetical protein